MGKGAVWRILIKKKKGWRLGSGWWGGVGVVMVVVVGGWWWLVGGGMGVENGENEDGGESGRST